LRYRGFRKACWSIDEGITMRTNTKSVTRLFSNGVYTLLGIAAGVTAASVANVAYAQEEPAIEEIVVTARWREERLQETPLAISAFSGANLEAKNLINITDVDQFAPNTVIQPLGAGWGSTAAAYIRGIGLGDNSLSYEPGVPIYIDDVYHGRPQGALFDLLDLERVEVLRGPQGTLFGKNAIGGTVRMISRKPQGDGSGFLEATIGRFDRVDVRGSFDVALVEDKLFARVSASSKNRDGYFYILDYECVNGAGSLGPGGTLPPLGSVLGPTDTRAEGGCVVDTLGGEHVNSVRGMLRWVASDAFEANFTVDYSNEDNEGPADKYTIIDPTFGLGLTDLWNQFVAVPMYGIPYDDTFITSSPYTGYHRFGPDGITGRDVQNVRLLDHWGTSLVLDWDISDNMHLKSITAYREFENTFGRDSDGSPLPEDITWDTSKHKQFTQEFQLTGSSMGGNIDWATGAFFYQANDSNQGWNALYPLFFVAQNHKDEQEVENWAVFVHGTYNFTDQLSVTAGVRYTEDDKTVSIFRQDQISLAVIIPNTMVTVQAEEFSPKIGLNYQLSDDILTYASWSTGFRGGGFSPRPSSPVQVAAFDIEDADSYEIGAKTEWADGRLRLNGALFYSEHHTPQSPSQATDSEGNLWFRTINTGEAEIWGAELELLAQPTDAFQIEASLGHLDFYRSDTGGSTLCSKDSSGNDCPGLRTPDWSGALGLTYTFALGNGSTVSLRGDAIYQSKIWFSADDPVSTDPSIGFQKAHTVVNGRISWISPDETWEAALLGTNLTDEVYFHGKLSLVGLLQRQQGNVAAPREWGLTIRRNF
jgi:iron complex outermembrane receptor protein